MELLERQLKFSEKSCFLFVKRANGVLGLLGSNFHYILKVSSFPFNSRDLSLFFNLIPYVYFNSLLQGTNRNPWYLNFDSKSFHKKVCFHNLSL